MKIRIEIHSGLIFWMKLILESRKELAVIILLMSKQKL